MIAAEMDAQPRRARRQGCGAGWPVAALLAAALALGACSGARDWQPGTADRYGDNCVWQGGSDGQERVINYADPELCGRPVEMRGPEHVRTPSPAPDSSTAQ